MAAGSPADVCSGPWLTLLAIARSLPPSAAPFEVPVAPRNPGMPLELDWVEEVRVNRSAVERRAATLRDPAHGQEGMAGRLAAPRRHPDGPHDAVGRRHAGPRPAALRQGAPPGPRRTCSRRWARASCRSGSARSASTTRSSRPRSRRSRASAFRSPRCRPDFPAGLSPLAQRLAEIQASVAAGAEEIDIVITRAHVLTENWRALYDEVRAIREACGDAHIKTILATGELGTLRNVARASLVCMMAGADFIKTSTGKERVNATLPVGLVMARADPRLPRAHRPPRRPQAGRRDPHGEGVARLAGADQGGAGRPLAPARSVPLRREQPAHRHRAAARALRDRAVLGGAPPSRGVSASRGP